MKSGARREERRADEPQRRQPRRVPLFDLRVDQQLLEAGEATLASGWWSMGAKVAEFERSFAAFVGAKHALAVSSGTAALHLAVLAAGCGPGDEVVVPSLTFVAAANTVAVTGARPVFCDVAGPDDLNLDPADAEAAVTPATRAVIVVHYGGFPCDVDAVLAFAERHRLLVIEDCAHAPGALLGGRACGTLGHMGCFSFFSNKNLPVGEGGMLVTDDDALADRVRLLRSHGMTTTTWERHRGHASSYDVVAAGLNYRLDELRAAIGIVQLGRLAGENDSRARIVARYREALDGKRGISLPFAADDAERHSAHHLAVALLPPGTERVRVREQLAAQGVETSVHYPPIHRFTAYSDNDRELPVTDSLVDRILTLPLYAHLADEDVGFVADTLLRAVDAER
ncbi:MAG: DegT/DnrJ/EryC1/StrS family aminotransferase [Gaiellaceae bacterium]